MAKQPYIEVIQKNLFGDPNWGPYARGETGMPSQQQWPAGGVACFLFYIGDLERAREVSLMYGVFREQEASRLHEYAAIPDLFKAALYRDLAQTEVGTQEMWWNLIEKRRKLNEEEMLLYRGAHYWIYEAYALAKLGKYDEVTEPARRGFEGLRNHKGTDKAPHQNSREYGLAAVLEALATYKLDPTPTGKEAAQKTLIMYKKENVRYGRLGYIVIFDLQFSYPDVFTTVLPGPDPNKD